MRRSEKIANRRVPLEKRAAFQFSSAIKAATANEAYENLIDYMSPIEPEYTEKAFEQADRVMKHLKDKLSSGYIPKFDYQGSVTSDTHIKVYSDIDLLILCGYYTTYFEGYKVDNPATKEEVFRDLTSLRKDTVEIVDGAFSAVTVDDSGPKAVRLSGGSLEREVDLVFANHWHTKEYYETGEKKYLGIRVLTTGSVDRIPNKPFLHNWNIDQKDSRTNGGLRKSIRLLKGLKYDREPEVSLSSYDIAAIGYSMPESELSVRAGEFLKLAQRVKAYLHKLYDDSAYRESLYVPNGMRKIFGTGGASITGLKELRDELDATLAEISSTESYLIQLDESKIMAKEASRWSESRPKRVVDMLK